MINQIRRKTPKKWKKPKNRCLPNQFKNCQKLAKSTMLRRNNTSKNRKMINPALERPKMKQRVVLGQELIPVMMHLFHGLTINPTRMVTLLQTRTIILPSITKLLPLSKSQKQLCMSRRMRRITKITI